MLYNSGYAPPPRFHRPHRPALHHLHPMAGFAMVHRSLSHTLVAPPWISIPSVHSPLVQRCRELVWRAVGMAAGTRFGFGVGDGSWVVWEECAAGRKIMERNIFVF